MILLHHILNYIILYYIILYCIILYYIYCIIFIVLYCTILYYILYILYCIVLYLLYYIILYYIILYYIILYYIILYYIMGPPSYIWPVIIRRIRVFTSSLTLISSCFDDAVHFVFLVSTARSSSDSDRLVINIVKATVVLCCDNNRRSECNFFSLLPVYYIAVCPRTFSNCVDGHY